MKFKVGDKVVCIDNIMPDVQLTLGSVYIIEKINDFNLLIVNGVSHYAFNPCRFRMYKKTSEKLTEIEYLNNIKDNFKEGV